MQRLLGWVNRVSLWAAFIVLLGSHAMMYYWLGTQDWFLIALAAALVWTGLLAIVQYAAGGRSRAR